MTTPPNPGQLNIQGAVDLSALAAARKAQAEAAQAPAAAPGLIINVTDASFEQDVVLKSKQVPVIVDFWAEWCGPCKQLSPILEKLTSEYAGKIVLAKVDSDANPALGQAFQVQSIPSVFLVLDGQAQALFQGAVPEAQVRTLFEQVVKIAEEAGLSGLTVESSDAAVEADEVEEILDPRLERAYAAIEKGQWDDAEAAYKEILHASPADVEAKAGLVQVALMRRTDGVDLDAVAAAPITNDVERLAASDALMILGETAAAFECLIEGIRINVGDDRNQFKERLLDLFVIMGETPEVRDARRALTNALF